MNVNLIVEKIRNLWKKNEGTGKNMSKKEKWIMFFLVGLLLMVIFIPMEQSDLAEKSAVEEVKNTSLIKDSETTIQAYEKMLSERLVQILEEIDGAGKVSAWVTVAESEEVVFSLEGTKEVSSKEEADSAGGKRIESTKTQNQTVVVDSNGNPYITKTIQPKVEGVFVVAEGAGNSVVKKNISDAVEVLFGIDAHRIKVAKKKLEE